MNWFTSLLFNDSVGRTVMIFAFVIAIGSMLGKLKLKGISLGSTFVLFVGILVSHFGFTVNASILHFMKEPMYFSGFCTSRSFFVFLGTAVTVSITSEIYLILFAELAITAS